MSLANKVLLKVLIIISLLIVKGDVNGQVVAIINTNSQTIGYGDTVSVCQGNTISYQSLSRNATSVRWIFKNGSISTSNATNVNVSYNAVGIDSTILIATGASSNDTTFIYVRVSNIFPSANFGYTPSSTVCGNTLIGFNVASAVTGDTYLWDFGDGTTSTTANPSHAYLSAIGASGTQSFNATLQVTNSLGCKTISPPQAITVFRIPDAAIGNGSTPSVTTSTYNGLTTFSRCVNDNNFTFVFTNTSSTTAINSEYTFEWGDLSAPTVLPSWAAGATVSHNYPRGLYKLVVKVKSGSSTCEGIKEYNVFLGTTPLGAIGLSTVNYICVRDTFRFPVFGTTSNPPGTTYEFSFNDGSPVVIYPHPPPDTIKHVPLSSSCGITSAGVANSFVASLRIRNPCTPNPSPTFAGSLFVSGEPIADMRIQPSSNVCVNSNVTILNTSLYGNAVVPPNNNCSDVGKQVWNIIPSTGFTITSGSLGSLGGSLNNSTNWVNGSNSLGLNFSVPGTYTVKLYIGNPESSCAIDSITRTICVRNPPQASFTMSSRIACNTGTATITNTSPIGTCGGDTYNWTVTYLDPLACGTGSNFSFINGTDATSANPQLQFNAPGQYVVTLTVSALNASALSCPAAIVRDTFTVKSKPKVTINPISAVCVGDSVRPTATVATCYSTSALTYAWNFPGGLQNSSSNQIPNGIFYGTQGNYWAILEVTNECGTGIDSQQVVVTQRPIPNAGVDTTFCSGVPVVLGTTPSAGLTYQWSPATGLNNANIANPTLTLLYGGPSSDTVYCYVLTASAGANCSGSDTVCVTVKRGPLLVKNNPVPICPGGAAKDTLVITGANTYVWSPLQNIVLNAIGDTAIVSPPISTLYYVTGSLSNGCSAKDSFLVSVGVKPDLGPDVAPVVRCAGQPVDLNTLYNTSGLIANWTINGSVVSNPNNITVSGIYQLVATSATGCADTAFANVTFNPGPNLGPDTAVSICSGSSFNLYSVIDTTGLTVIWRYNNTIVANPTFVTAAGIYTGIALNGSSCADTVRIILAVNPKPNLGPDKDTTVCAGQPVNLNTFYNTTGYASITWTLNSVVVANPLAAISPGSYQLIVVTSQGCSDTANLTVFNKPTPSLGNDQNIPICTGQTVNLNTVFNIASLVTSWSLAGSPVNRPDSVTVSGSYQLIAINNEGCHDTALANVVVSAQPNLNPPQQTVSTCTGNPVDLTTLYNTTGFNTFWSLGGNPVTNPNIVIVPGTYMLIAESNPGGSCKDTAFVTLIFNPNYNVGPDTTVYICPGQTADLTVLYNTAGFVPQWTFNGITVSNPGAVTQPGAYKLKVTNNFGCSDSAIVTLVQKLKPNLGNDTMVMACQGIPVNLNSLYNTFGLSATWTLSGSTVLNPTGINLPGIYTLIATNNQTGCSDTALANIIFNSKPNLGPDKVFTYCIGDTVNVANSFFTAGYLAIWTPTLPSAVSSAGIFTCTAIDLFSGCSDTASASVLFRPKPELGNNVFIDACVGTYINLPNYFPNPLGATQVWTNNGVVVTKPDSVLATPNTVYRIVANNGGCYDTAFLTIGNVNIKPVISPRIIQQCFPDSLLRLDTLYPGNFASIEWSNSTGAIIGQPYVVSQPGVYKVVVSNIFGCRDSATVKYMLQPKINAFAGNDTNVVRGTTFQLNGSGGNVYLWNPGIPLIDNPRIPNPTARLFSNTLFYLEVRDTANLKCLGKDTVFIRVFDYADIFVPNAFTPGVDPNRIFIPVYVGIRELKLFRIYNRWGMMLFETKDMSKGWDGTYKGQPQELGNYVWILQAVDNKNQPIQLNGNVTLLR